LPKRDDNDAGMARVRMVQRVKEIPIGRQNDCATIPRRGNDLSIIRSSHRKIANVIDLMAK